MPRGRPPKPPGTHVYFAGEWVPLAKALADALNNTPDWSKARKVLIQFYSKIRQQRPSV